MGDGGIPQWYRGCSADGDSAMCLCLSEAAMLAIIVPITVAFLGLMAFFVLVAIGFQPTKVPEFVPVSSVELEMSAVTKSPDAEADAEAAGDFSYDDEKIFHADDPMGTGKKKPPVLIGWRVVLGLLAYTFVPFVDNMTDLAFLLSNPFYNKPLFVALIVAYCAPALGFAKMLVDMKASPRFYIVPIPHRFLWKEYNSLYKVVLGIAILVPFVVLNALFLAPWITVGVLLYTTKALAVKPVRNLWLHVWTGGMFAKPGTILYEQRRRDIEDALFKPIDERVLNESLTAHFVLETFPIVAIQVGSWDCALLTPPYN